MGPRPQQSDAADSEQLITRCQGLVRNLAWKIHRKIGGRVDLEDLIGYGQVGLAEAASRFDPSKKIQFTTFAYYRIRGAILDGLKKMDWFKPAEFHASRYEAMATALLEDDDDHGSDNLEDHAHWLTDVSCRLAVVYLASTLEGEERPFMSELVDPMDSSPAQCAMQHELQTRLRQLIDELPSQARSLIRWTYFEGVTLKEVGERLGISKSWASRLHDKTLRKLAKELGTE